MMEMRQQWPKELNDQKIPNENDDDLFKNSMGFSRSKTFNSNLPKQVGILSSSIQIVFQNIENSSIREHVKIGLKTTSFSRIY